MIRAIIVALLLVAVSSCTGKDQAAEREAYWSAATGKFFAQPRQLGELHAWLREKNVYYTFNDSDIVNGAWNVGLETVLVETLVCEAWNVRLSVHVTSSGQITDHKITKQGRCL
jgi:hypothetical protein